MYRLFKNAREPMSSYTHFLGMIFRLLQLFSLFC